MASDDGSQSRPGEAGKPPPPAVETDPRTGIPLVPRVGDAQKPSMNGFEAVLRANRSLLSARDGLSGGKRRKPVTVHFTEQEYALLEACASYTGEEIAPFVRRMFFAKLRELFP